MSKLIKVITFLIISTITLNPLFAESINDIPIIVIAPSKKAQSKSTVGTSVTVFDEKYLQESNDFFLHNVLGDQTTSFNMFSSGGYGTTSGVQLRGLPKRYSTVFIDGVKQGDPSSVSGDYEFSNVLTNQISRVEILKGNQTSVYGSGAIGGAINVTTKRGKQGFQRDVSYNTASSGTHNLALSMSGADDKHDFYVGGERFITDGISTMNNNSEKDGYTNNTIVANYGYKLSDKLKFETSIRGMKNYLQYDTLADKDLPHEDSDESHILETQGTAALVYNPNEKFNNRLTYANYYIKRIYNTFSPASGKNADGQDHYYGDRKSLQYLGNYNIDLDSSVTFGLGTEFDEVNYKPTDAPLVLSEEGFQTYSSYFDYQKRFTDNFYATFGARLDHHSLVNNQDSHRATAAYLFDDKTTKLKGSYGTGFRFPSLYEAYWIYGNHPGARERMKPETSKGFDFGIEKAFTNLGLNIDLTYFNTRYFDALEGWASNDDYDQWGSTMNSESTTKAQGLEFVSKWIANKSLNFDLNYTYTSTYDGAEHANPDLLDSYTNSQMVRVPRQFLNLATNYVFPDKNLNLTLRTKLSSKARDYGTANEPSNGSFDDVRLNSYMVNDLSLTYNLWGTYNLFFDINNILDKKYETTVQYSMMDREINFGIKRAF